MENTRRFKFIVSEIIIFLLLSCQPVLAELTNGDFSSGLSGWTVENGDVTDGGGYALFQEDAFFFSILSQEFTLGPGAQILSFDIIMTTEPDADFVPDSFYTPWPDAFTVSLLDPATSTPLIWTVSGLTDFYYGDNSGYVETVATVTGNTISLDVSALVGQSVYLVFDSLGNDDGSWTSVALDNVNVEYDTAPPVFTTVPQDMTVESDGSGNLAELNAWLANVAAEDVYGSVSITHDFTSLSDDCGDTGSATTTWTAEDECGNKATTAATFTIIDTTPPVFTTVPQDVNVECDGSGNSAELNAWLNSAAGFDICGNVSISNDFSSLSNDCGSTGLATVTWTAVDDCGNAATTSAALTVVDTTPPSIICPADVTLECAADTNVAATGSATGSDTCGGVTIAHSDSSVPGCGNAEVITRTWTATDECGNSSLGVQTITVVDTTPPVFTATPNDVTVQRDGNGNVAELDAWLGQTVGADDTCGSVAVANDFTSGPNECGNTGSVTVTWTATDDCDNPNSTSATFIIEDPTASVMYDGDLLLSTGGSTSINANLVAMLRDDMGNPLGIDGEEVTFTLTADGVGTIVESAATIDGAASATVSLEPAIYMIKVTLGCSDLTASAILVVYNPEGGFATGGGWFVPEDDGLNTYPNVRANFGFNAKYKQDNPTGHLEFRYSDGFIDLKSTSIEQLVITGGKVVQFKGWASVNKVDGHWFFVKAIDNGEPGIYVDTFEIKIWAPGVSEEGDPTDRAGGVLQGGNIVVHTK
jgi:hypothetical protein